MSLHEYKKKRKARDEAYNEGFDAGVASMKTELDKLVFALETTMAFGNGSIGSEALALYREFHTGLKPVGEKE